MQCTANTSGAVSGTHPRVVIACRVMQPELDALAQGSPALEVRYLDQSMHERPVQMPAVIQAEIDAVARYAGQIVLGYGLCSNGIAGVKAPRQGLLVPRVHDCISLFLGSRAAYERVFYEEPGTYYLTPGWVEDRKDPLGIMACTYAPKMGPEKAEWGMREELKNYTRFVMIDSQTEAMTPLRKIAMENARFFGLRYEEMPGDTAFFRKILFGPYPQTDFIYLKPCETLQQEMIIDA